MQSHLLIVLILCAVWKSEAAESSDKFDDVMNNQRSRSIFWIYLYKIRLHENLSFWTEIETEIKPELEARRVVRMIDVLDFTNEKPERPLKYHNFANFARTYLQIGAAAYVTVRSADERLLMDEIYDLMSKSQYLSLEESDKLLVLLKQAQEIVKNILRQYHFVLFVASDEWREIKQTTSVLPLLSSAGLENHQPQKWNPVAEIEPGMNPVDAVVRFDMTTAETFDSNLLYHSGIELPQGLESFFDPLAQGAIKSIAKRKRPEYLTYETSISCSDTPFYAAVLIRYIHVRQKGKSHTFLHHWYLPAGLMVLSRYPVFKTLRQRLKDIHQQALEEDDNYLSDTKWKPKPEALGRLIAPWGPDGPEVGFKVLGRQLRAENLVKLVGAVLLEKQIAIVASRFSKLTMALEGLKVLIQPLVWSHVFFPTLPKCAIEGLECPVPFIFGIHSSFMPKTMDPDSEVVVVNLDQDLVKGMDMPKVLLDLIKPVILRLQRKQTNMTQDKIVMMFHKFIQDILRNAVDYRFRLNDGINDMVVFDSQGFLADNAEEDGFYETFIHTVMFSQYISTIDRS